MSTDESETATDEYRRLQDNPHVSEVPREFHRPNNVPVWEDDPYLDAIALRLMHHYDLERDKEVDSQVFPMYGRLVIENERHVLHPALSFGYHRSTEHLFVARPPTISEQTLTQAETLGLALADEWVSHDTEHYSTDFTFVFVTSPIPDSVTDWITGYEHRELYKYGYHGHYELNFVATDPEHERLITSANSSIEELLRTWDRPHRDQPSRLSRFLSWITR